MHFSAPRQCSVSSDETHTKTMFTDQKGLCYSLEEHVQQLELQKHENQIWKEAQTYIA
jgi:hypothetical protein